MNADDDDEQVFEGLLRKYPLHADAVGELELMMVDWIPRLLAGVTIACAFKSSANRLEFSNVQYARPTFVTHSGETRVLRVSDAYRHRTTFSAHVCVDVTHTRFQYRLPQPVRDGAAAASMVGLTRGVLCRAAASGGFVLRECAERENVDDAQNGGGARKRQRKRQRKPPRKGAAETAAEAAAAAAATGDGVTAEVLSGGAELLLVARDAAVAACLEALVGKRTLCLHEKRSPTTATALRAEADEDEQAFTTTQSDAEAAHAPPNIRYDPRLLVAADVVVNTRVPLFDLPIPLGMSPRLFGFSEPEHAQCALTGALVVNGVNMQVRANTEGAPNNAMVYKHARAKQWRFTLEYRAVNRILESTKTFTMRVNPKTFEFEVSVPNAMAWFMSNMPLSRLLALLGVCSAAAFRRLVCTSQIGSACSRWLQRAEGRLRFEWASATEIAAELFAGPMKRPPEKVLEVFLANFLPNAVGVAAKRFLLAGFLRKMAKAVVSEERACAGDDAAVAANGGDADDAATGEEDDEDSDADNNDNDGEAEDDDDNDDVGDDVDDEDSDEDDNDDEDDDDNDNDGQGAKCVRGRGTRARGETGKQSAPKGRRGASGSGSGSGGGNRSIKERGNRWIDDRDSVAAKTVKGTGQTLGFLVRQLMASWVTEMCASVNWRMEHGGQLSALDVVSHARFAKRLNVHINIRCMSTTQSDNHKGLLAPKIEGLNPYATRAQNQKITSGLKNTASKAIQPRLMRGNGFAKLCPCDTPEGAQSGKINATCAGVRLSRGVPFTAMRNILLALRSCVCAAGGGARCDGNEDSGACVVRGPAGPAGEHEMLFGLCLNGSLIGRVRCARTASAEIRHARRRGALPPSVSVAVDRHFKAVMVRCDAGRLLTPMYVAERAGDVADVLATARRYGRTNPLAALEACGCVEWIDSYEQNEVVLAHSRAQLEAHHTHALLHPTAMLSAVLGHSVLCNHNQTPRSIYFACHHAQTMGWHPMRGPTQDFGIFSSNHWLSLCTPQRPVVRTLIEDVHYAHDLVPVLNGSTVIVGVGALGHNIEDALVFNEASLQRGLFAFESHNTVVINLPKCSDTFIVAPTLEVAGKKVCASGRDLYHALAHDGLPKVGKTLEPNDVILGKVRAAPSAARNAVDMGAIGGGAAAAGAGAAAASGANTCCSVVTKVGGRVERVHVATTHKAGTIVLVLLTTLCTPSVGDKFTDRSAQKGVIGAILPDIDLPRTLRDGITPDVFFNPAGLISRMTVAKLAEILLGKDALVQGKSFADGTPFMDLQAAARAATEALRARGYDGTRERMVSGTTGEVMEGFCSVGPLHMCPLKHLAQPKAYARGRSGVNDPFTRRPADGRMKQGGFRVGEMEHAALLSAGASFASNEFATLANPHVAYVCTECGRIGPSPPPRAFAVVEQAKCGHCGMEGVMEAVDGTFTQFAIFDKTLAALGIRLTYALRPINAHV